MDSAPQGLTVEKIHVWRGDRHVLKGVSLALGPGELLQVAGPNGTGKTTLLRILGGLGKAGRGRVSILGKDARSGDTRQRIGILGHGIGVESRFLGKKGRD